MARPLLLIFSLQFARIRCSCSFSKSCGFEYALWVKSLSYLEHSPSSTNSMSCSIKALICHLCCLFSIPAMMKKPSISFICFQLYSREQKKIEQKHYILDKTRSRSSSNTVDSFHCFINLNIFFGCIELLSKKQSPNQVGGTWKAS
jgi:hypothetical protein